MKGLFSRSVVLSVLCVFGVQPTVGAIVAAQCSVKNAKAEVSPVEAASVLLAQRSREFDDPPPFGQDPGPDYIRDDFRGTSSPAADTDPPPNTPPVDEIEEPTLEFLDANGCYVKYELAVDSENITYIKSITAQYPGDSGCQGNPSLPNITVTAFDARFDQIELSSNNGSRPVLISGLNSGDWTFRYFDDNGIQQTETLSINTLTLSSKGTDKHEPSEVDSGSNLLTQASSSHRINCQRLRGFQSDCKRGKNIENKLLTLIGIGASTGPGQAVNRLKEMTQGTQSRRPVIQLQRAPVRVVNTGAGIIGVVGGLANTLMSGSCSILFGNKYDNALITRLRVFEPVNYSMGKAYEYANRRIGEQCTVEWKIRASNWSIDDRGNCYSTGEEHFSVREMAGDLSGQLSWSYVETGRPVPGVFSFISGQINSSGDLTMTALYGLYDIRFTGQEVEEGFIQGEMIGCGGQPGEFRMVNCNLLDCSTE